MTIDERFDLDAFLRVSKDPDALQSLSAELQGEIDRRLHDLVLPEVREVVSLLNQLGHRLMPYYQPTPGDIAFRDDQTKDGKYSCRLRLGVDVVVSVGFSDTVDEELEDGSF